MVKGQTAQSISFLEKAHRILKDKSSIEILNSLKKERILSREQQLFWAEKILDQYLFKKKLNSPF